MKEGNGLKSFQKCINFQIYPIMRLNFTKIKTLQLNNKQNQKIKKIKENNKTKEKERKMKSKSIQIHTLELVPLNALLSFNKISKVIHKVGELEIKLKFLKNFMILKWLKIK